MKILLISDYLPYPLISGDRLRVYHLVRNLSRDHAVTLCALFWPTDDPQAIEEMRKLCRRVEIGEIHEQSKLAHLPGLLSFGLSGKPLELKFNHSPALAEKIRQVTAGEEFDIIQIEHSHMAYYREYIAKTQKAKLVLSSHNIVFDQVRRIFSIEKQLGEKLRLWLFSQQMRRWEIKYSGKFDRCIFVSENDRQLLLSKNPGLAADVVPNGVDTVSLQEMPLDAENKSLIYIGSMGYKPVSDGAVFFCKSVLPLIRQTFAHIDVWLVGREPTSEVLELADDHIHVTGQVPDIKEYYEKASISIVPLRAGGGTRLKILEAMALGKPVVSTSIGCEGLDVVHGKHLLVADTPQEFAQAIIDLFTNQELAQSIRLEARKLVVEQYEWRMITENLVNIYQTTINSA